MVWWKVFNVGVWTDATLRRHFEFREDVNNQLYITKSNANNRNTFYCQAGGVAHNESQDGLTTVGWNCAVMTRSESANALKYYHNATLINTDNVIGNWAGAGNFAWATIGSQGVIPNFPWYGWLAHVAVFDSVLGQSAVTDLANP